jgi:hypothetical protein
MARQLASSSKKWVLRVLEVLRVLRVLEVLEVLEERT